MKSKSEKKCTALNPKLKCISDQKRKLYAIVNGRNYIISDWHKYQEAAWDDVANNLGISTP